MNKPVSKPIPTEVVVRYLRQSDAGKALCRLAANRIQEQQTRIEELESELHDAQSAADFYQNEADHYYGVSEADGNS
jgi:hypothetical protein